MSKTHDYDTKFIAAKYLNGNHVLVGECGGLSAVFHPVMPGELVMGCMAVETEHGTLYIDPVELVQVLS